MGPTLERYPEPIYTLAILSKFTRGAPYTARYLPPMGWPSPGKSGYLRMRVGYFVRREPLYFRRVDGRRPAIFGF